MIGSLIVLWKGDTMGRRTSIAIGACTMIVGASIMAAAGAGPGNALGVFTSGRSESITVQIDEQGQKDTEVRVFRSLDGHWQRSQHIDDPHVAVGAGQVAQSRTPCLDRRSTHRRRHHDRLLGRLWILLA